MSYRLLKVEDELYFADLDLHFTVDVVTSFQTTLTVQARENFLGEFDLPKICFNVPSKNSYIETTDVLKEVLSILIKRYTNKKVLKIIKDLPDVQKERHIDKEII